MEDVGQRRLVHGRRVDQHKEDVRSQRRHLDHRLPRLDRVESVIPAVPSEDDCALGDAKLLKQPLSEMREQWHKLVEEGFVYNGD